MQQHRSRKVWSSDQEQDSSHEYVAVLGGSMSWVIAVQPHSPSQHQHRLSRRAPFEFLQRYFLLAWPRFTG
jgi:hypothetical protein